MTSLSTISFDGVPINEQPYLDLLDHVISDRKITDEERAALADLAQQLGLDTAAQADAHRRFVSAMTDRALDDGLVTEEEFGELLAMASLLGVDATRVVARTARARSQSTSIQLSPGLSVCFTGEPVVDGWPVERSTLEAHARALGLVSRSSVTRAAHLLVAADAASRSGKAGKAHSYGIPIISAELFLRAGPGDVIEADVTTVRQRAVQACATCGVLMVLDLDQNRRVGRVCELCAAAPGPAKSTTATNGPRPVDTSPVAETLMCEMCGTAWERTVARGRKPKLCNNCAS